MSSHRRRQSNKSRKNKRPSKRGVLYGGEPLGAPFTTGAPVIAAPAITTGGKGMIATATVPLVLLAANQMVGRSSRPTYHSRRRYMGKRRFSRRRR
jgi:hypothetical protein